MSTMRKNNKQDEVIFQRDVQELTQGDFTDRLMHLAHIKAWQLVKEKNRLLFARAAKRRNPCDDDYFYCISAYLSDLCQRLRMLLGGITGIGCKNISVELFYRMGKGTRQSGWRLIRAKELGSGEVAVTKKFIEQRSPLVRKAFAGELGNFYVTGKTPEEEAMYCMSTDFGTGEETYVKAFLLVTVARADFREMEKSCRILGREFQEVLESYVFPYFGELIEGELASMYLWKKWQRQNEKKEKP